MYKKPFTKEYVLRTTLQNMRGAVDLSMRKTIARLDDYPETPDQKLEILSTLASLDQLHKTIQSIEDHNPDLFGKDNA